MNKSKIYLNKLNYYKSIDNIYKINKYEYKLTDCEKTKLMSQTFFDLLNKDDIKDDNKKDILFIDIKK